MQNQISFDIIPNIERKKVIVKAEVKVMEIVLFMSVTVFVHLKDENDMLIDVKRIVIEQPEYDLWTSDDTLIDLIKNKINQ